MQLARRGDKAAIDQLLDRHRDRLKRMVTVRMDDRLSARFDPSDVVQETLINATRLLPRFLEERPLPFYPWLRQIAWQRLLDLHRRHLHAESRSVASEASWTVSNDSIVTLARQLVASDTSPSRRVVRNELRDRVRQALERISQDDNDLLLMRHLEQLKVAEIAAVLKVSESAVKSRLRRSLVRLQREIGDEIGENL